MDSEILEIIEEYNQDGICIKRTINCLELPPDKEPSIKIFVDLCTGTITQKFYMSKNQVKNKFGKSGDDILHLLTNQN